MTSHIIKPKKIVESHKLFLNQVVLASLKYALKSLTEFIFCLKHFLINSMRIDVHRENFEYGEQLDLLTGHATFRFSGTWRSTENSTRSRKSFIFFVLSKKLIISHVFTSSNARWATLLPCKTDSTIYFYIVPHDGIFSIFVLLKTLFSDLWCGFLGCIIQIGMPNRPARFTKFYLSGNSCL